MKTYGVNWFLVWVGMLALFLPITFWVQELTQYNLGDLSHPRSAAWVSTLFRALSFSLTWTCLYYYLHGKTLSDPKAVERARQSLQRSASARTRRYRWPIMLAVVGIASTTCRLIFGWPSWLHVAGYSLLVPCGCLAATWLIDEAAKNGQLAQLMKNVQDGSRTSD